MRVQVFTSSAVKNIGRFNCEFVKGELLGRGAFGSAWRCLHLVDEQDYCVKEVRLTPSKFHGSARRMVEYARGILREVSALSHCESHHNVVKYNAAWAELVTEREVDGPAEGLDSTIDDSGLDADRDTEGVAEPPSGEGRQPRASVTDLSLSTTSHAPEAASAASAQKNGHGKKSVNRSWSSQWSSDGEGGDSWEGGRDEAGLGCLGGGEDSSVVDAILAKGLARSVSLEGERKEEGKGSMAEVKGIVRRVLSILKEEVLAVKPTRFDRVGIFTSTRLRPRSRVHACTRAHTPFPRRHGRMSLHWRGDRTAE